MASADFTVGFARLSEGGIVSNVYGCTNAPNFSAYAKSFESYLVRDMTLMWIPSNTVNKMEDIAGSKQMTSYISPIEFVDDPDTFNCLGYT